MPDKSYSDELTRALARPDIGDLRHTLAVHHAFSVNKEAQSDDAWTDECEAVFLSGHDDPDLALAFLALAASTYDEPEYLGLLAAGPMEDALGIVAPKILDRIIVESRRNARFRWMLSGVWLHAIHPDNVEAVRAAVGAFHMDRGVSLPARP